MLCSSRFSPEKGRGFKFDVGHLQQDDALQNQPGQRSLREKILDYLALEKERKEAERRREELDKKEGSADEEETMFQEKKRSTYK